jgi:hypothetical protein
MRAGLTLLLLRQRTIGNSKSAAGRRKAQWISSLGGGCLASLSGASLRSAGLQPRASLRFWLGLASLAVGAASKPRIVPVHVYLVLIEYLAI